jgi:membrane protein required for colicin V production
MANPETVTILDGIVLVILLVGITRGAFIGMVREVLSMAGLAGAVLAARYGTPATAMALEDISRGAVSPSLAPWLAGTLLGIGAIVVATMISRLIQRGVRAAGLGWLDRIGGGLFGAAEGALVGLLVVLGATFIMGREHPSIDGSRSLALYDAAHGYLGKSTEDLPNIAAPGDWL